MQGTHDTSKRGRLNTTVDEKFEFGVFGQSSMVYSLSTRFLIGLMHQTHGPPLCCEFLDWFRATRPFRLGGKQHQATTDMSTLDITPPRPEGVKL